ncbi:MAG: hypothetical protein H6920_09345 [Sphingomonadaceae bacterium]|nr:hypothetical protein [Sphingomonadaceae bacterium]
MSAKAKPQTDGNSQLEEMLLRCLEECDAQGLDAVGIKICEALDEIRQINSTISQRDS